ncbi:RICIN domain-containing protein [Streptomyces neyagawaensis]|uniref:RICIN domain-containing protein n=1 Tax=Streptomyces neyagawaensis TaxID=42238 RepID=A0ABV3ASF9_9ACTN
MSRVERWLRSVTALAVLITVTVTVLVLPARPASAADTCDGGDSRQWDLREDGTIHNPATGECAGTDGGLAPGTPFVLLSCAPDLQWLLTGPEPDKQSSDTSSRETR